ncbi:response regulator transcription factor [Dyadobacter arcticus]|uniref:DNA-binding CsgD family transcriptional regulator n=1 Tax=Dyadobacter arcticus TaxID=1078754 RepID=A0ABX0URQ9_9BACT|nr:response regulator transcription factor [Dyadobacter arcticus]NIJ55667.1 DNA-binding CsgD family transcriptional regulator [Dyadobacter arcticus]
MSLTKQEYLAFKARCAQFLTDVEYPLRVSEEEHGRFLNTAKITAGHERFSFVVNLLSFEITHCIGAERWLGYSSRPYSMFDYFKSIHPSYVEQLMQMAIATLEVTNQFPGSVRYMDQRIIACIPMKDKNGEYWWVKRESASFQFDAKGRITAYANLFTVVKEYDGESMTPRYSDQAGNSKNELYDMFVERYQQRIRERLPFTKRQFEILQIYSEGAGWTSQQVGRKLSISKQTIDKHNQSILTAARNQYARLFISANEVAHFLRTEKII